MLRVILIDDHPIIREGLKLIISQGQMCTVVAESGDGFDAIEVVRKTPADVVIIDIALPKRNGIELLKQIRAEYPRLPVLMLTGLPEIQYAVRSFRAGASGYLTKDKVATDLINAIQRIATGKKYISAEASDYLAIQIDATTACAGYEKLSDREQEIVCLMASGRSLSEIAELLSLSAKTISTYRARALEKLQLKNNAEVIRYAIKERMVE